MYHRIVAPQVRKAFAEISAGNWEAMVAGMAPSFTYRFYGDHALSGERHTHDALAALVGAVLPVAARTPASTSQDILVAGWPWDTRVATAVTVDVGVVDGSRYQNVVHQFLRIRWGKITEVRTLEDTAVLEKTLDRLAAAGFAEAHAAPITD